MTAAEASVLLVDVVRELSVTRRERDSWRLVALSTMRYAADLQRELAMVDERLSVRWARVQDRRDEFLDQLDVRREAA